MMRMLDAAGYPIFCDQAMSGYNYETMRAASLPGEAQWMNECEGRAVKVLDAARFTPPAGKTYLFLHMVRRPAHQAKSIAKYILKTDGARVTRQGHTAIKNEVRRITARTRALLGSLGEVIEVPFEKLIKGEVDQVADRLGLDANVMRSVIIPRGPQSLPYLLEETHLKPSTHLH